MPKLQEISLKASYNIRIQPLLCKNLPELPQGDTLDLQISVAVALLFAFLQMAANIMSTIPRDEYVLFVDGMDVLFNANLSCIWGAFAALELDAVFGAEVLDQPPCPLYLCPGACVFMHCRPW